MRFLDLLIMSVNNLRRRKLRTALTVLGVIIGVASVVIMVSLGIGLNALMLEQYASYGDMTTINVYSDSYYGFSNSDDTEADFLTDDVMDRFKRINHVEGVSPMLSTYVIMKQGIYETSVSITGVSKEYLEKIPLAEGQAPEEGDEMKLIYGNWIIQRFHNSKTGEGYWDTGELPDIDYMNKPMFVIFDTSAYYQSQGGGDNQVKPPKKYMINAAGVVEGGIDDYSSYAYSVYTDIEALKTQLKQIYKKNPIPDQPTNKKGKPYPYFIYQQAVVFVDDMANVLDVQQTLNDMGYQTDSQMQWIQQSQQTFDVIQLVLGGIGAISLFVAAIGIANTMIMSIYERTREIGVMKVIGAEVRDIRVMFLLEAGMIGLLGGIMGVGLSFAGSWAFNHFAAAAMLGEGSKLSVIPLWLVGIALAFSVLVGVVFGFLPANRAVKISALEAIKHD